MKTSRELIIEYGLTPNKALGQNFLTDEDAIRRIVRAAAEPGLPLLEIGPGLGALTGPLSQTGLEIAAVELDSVLADILSRELSENVTVINSDFLKVDLGKLTRERGWEEFCAVGNLPYYITSSIAMRLVSGSLPIRRMVLMMQREAADRFTAEPGNKNYVPLSVLNRLRFSITTLLELSPASYYPQPDVSSAVLVFDRIDRSLPENLPQVLKCAFAMRRKTLVNNLSALGIKKADGAALLEELGFSPTVRAEELSPEDLVRLAQAIACVG